MPDDEKDNQSGAADMDENALKEVITSMKEAAESPEFLAAAIEATHGDEDDHGGASAELPEPAPCTPAIPSIVEVAAALASGQIAREAGRAFIEEHFPDYVTW